MIAPRPSGDAGALARCKQASRRAGLMIEPDSLDLGPQLHLIDDGGGTLAPAADRTRQTTITLPEGNDGVGRIGFSLAVDVTNVVQENNVSGSAESNNAASVEVTSQLSPFTDLVVTDIAAAPASGWKPGDKVAVTWT